MQKSIVGVVTSHTKASNMTKCYDSSPQKIYINNEVNNFLHFEDTHYLIIMLGNSEEDYLQRFRLNLSQNGLKQTLHTMQKSCAILLIDKLKNKMYLTRDRYGLQTWYYYHDNSQFIFCENLLHFKNNAYFPPVINQDSLAQFLQYGYILQPYTIFKNCYKVKSEHYLEVSLTDLEIQEHQYIDSIKSHDKVTIPEDKIIAQTEHLLKESINTVSHHKNVGVLLSGGYDSSMIAALLQQDREKSIDTFTMGFENKGENEAPCAKKIAKYLGTNHHEYYFNASKLREALILFPQIYADPLGDKAAIASILIAKEAQHYVDVLYGGEGGDEVFGASGFFDRYKLLQNVPTSLEKITSKVLDLFRHSNMSWVNQTKFEKWQKMLQTPNLGTILKYKDITLSSVEINQLFLRTIQPLNTRYDEVSEKSSHKLDKYFGLMMQTYVIDDLVYKMQGITNYYKMTYQAPYLDNKLQDYLNQIDLNLKQKNMMPKYILKQIAYKQIPKPLLDRPKSGFSVSVSYYLQNDLKDMLEHYLCLECIKKEGIFNPSKIEALKKRFYQSCTHDYYLEQTIWNLLIFEIWYEYWFSV